MMTDACSSVCERSNFDNCVVLLIDSYVVHMYCLCTYFDKCEIRIVDDQVGGLCTLAYLPISRAKVTIVLGG